MLRKILLFIILFLIISAIPVQGYLPDFSITQASSTGKHYFNARYYNAVTETASPELPPGFLSPDIIIGHPDSGRSWNRYAYCRGNPVKLIDVNGKWLESSWDAFSLATGVASLVSSIKSGDIVGAIVDTAGIIADATALALPFVPGGAGVAIKTARLAGATADVIGGTIEITEGLENENNLQTGIGILQVTGGIGQGINALKEVKSVFPQKIKRQMSRRGWTEEEINEVINYPYVKRPAVNKANKNKATAYFRKDGAYIVRDNKTSEIIQISDVNDPNWIPDFTIKKPFLKERK